MKIDIIYRCCEAEVNTTPRVKRPVWFNKLKCLETFITSVKQAGDAVNSVTFLHDGVRGELYKALPAEYTVKCVDHNDNELSLLDTFTIADTCTGDVIYFIEDDYLHTVDAIKVILDGAAKFSLVTGYDHLDRYTRTDDITYNKESIQFLDTSNCHWRTVESTCCSWAATRVMWNNIKHSAMHYKLRDRDFFRNLVKNDIRLWSPIPGVTTQVDDRLSPGIDWSLL